MYDKILDLLWATPGFSDLVNEGNIIRFDQRDVRDPEKDKVISSDVPELRLTPNGGVPHTNRTSCSSSLVEVYTLGLITGDQRVSEALYPLKWIMFCAMTKWPAELSTLKYGDAEFVRRVKITGIQDGVSDYALNRGIKGWNSLWNIEVEMFFNTASLQGD